MIQEALFEAPVATPVADGSSVVSTTIKPAILAEPLGPCVRCGEPATLRSPGGSIYCAEHGRCGGKSVGMTALGVSVKICGRSVEEFVLHKRLQIWVCPCMPTGV